MQIDPTKSGGLGDEAPIRVASFAILTALTIAALYLGRESATSSYGAAGAVILILLWTYYSSAMVLTGACFTRAFGESAEEAKTPRQLNG